jgi:hypothetical protein
LTQKGTAVSRALKMAIKNNPPDFTVMPTLGVPGTDLLLDPSRLFLFLTKWTCPYGGEEQYYGNLLDGLGFHRDAHGNWYLAIGCVDGSYPTTCFAAHLDTADSAPKPIARFRSEGNVVTTDGKSILGADDRAGVTVLLSMAQRDVPGLYYLFVGEEVGCVGSRSVAKFEGLPDEIKKVICFDRRGYHDIITHQMGARSCSDEFAVALADAFGAYGLKYEPCANGSFTDSREFADDVPECTNISIGYERAHSCGESQDLDHLNAVVIAALNIDWEALPVARDPDAVDEDDWTQGYYSNRYADWANDYDWKSKEANTDDWASAIEDLADDFAMGVPPDEDLIGMLVQDDREETISAVYLLLDKLQSKVRPLRGFDDER